MFIGLIRLILHVDWIWPHFQIRLYMRSRIRHVPYKIIIIPFGTGRRSLSNLFAQEHEQFDEMKRKGDWGSY